MKRILPLVIIFCLYSCSVELLEKKDFIIVYPSDKLAFQCEASTTTLTVSCQEEWTIGDCSEWISVTPTKGSKGEDILVSVEDNRYNTTREGVFTINSGSASIDINVTQYGVYSDYIDLKIEDMENSITYDEDSGILSIVYEDTPPCVEKGQALVLTAKYGYDIRVVDSVSVTENTLSLQTSKGSMANLFKNTCFTLSTSGMNNTRNTADSMNVIAPAEMGFLDKDGTYHTIYTRASPPTNNRQEIWSFSTNFNGEVISENNAGKLYWETCSFDAGFNGVFSFKFGEQTLDDGRCLGEIEEFSYVLNGELDVDLLLHCYYEASADLSSGDEIIAENIIPTVVFKFMVGTIPVYIRVNTHLGKNTEFSVNGNIDVSSGVKLGVQGNIGLEWTKNSGVKIINSVSPSLDIYNSECLAQASVSAKVSYYPHVDIQLYNVLGPWMELRPYLKEVVEVGTLQNSNNCNVWQANTYAGLDMALGLNLMFGGSNISVWESETLNPVEETLLFEAPKRIRLLSPNDGTNVEYGETVYVVFLVESYSPLTGEYYPCPYALVNFEVDKGTLEQSTDICSFNGQVYARWNPFALGERTKINSVADATLTLSDSDMETRTIIARIPDQFGGVLDEVKLTINTDKESVLIQNITGTYVNDRRSYPYCSHFAISFDSEIDIITSDVNESYKYLLAYRINNEEFVRFADDRQTFYLKQNTVYSLKFQDFYLALQEGDFCDINYNSFIATREYEFFIWCKDLNCPVSPVYRYTLAYDEQPSIVIETPVLIDETHYSGKFQERHVYKWEAPVKMTGQLWFDSCEAGDLICEHECHIWDYYREYYEDSYSCATHTSRNNFFGGDIIDYTQFEYSYPHQGLDYHYSLTHKITNYKMWIEYKLQQSRDVIKSNTIQYKDDTWDHCLL